MQSARAHRGGDPPCLWSPPKATPHLGSDTVLGLLLEQVLAF